MTAHNISVEIDYEPSLLTCPFDGKPGTFDLRLPYQGTPLRINKKHGEHPNTLVVFEGQSFPKGYKGPSYFGEQPVLFAPIIYDAFHLIIGPLWADANIRYEQLILSIERIDNRIILIVTIKPRT